MSQVAVPHTIDSEKRSILTGKEAVKGRKDIEELRMVFGRGDRCVQHITKLLWASRAYETGPAIVMKWLIIHSTIATPEIARGAVIGEQDWMVELPVRSPPPHMDELKKEYPEKKSSV